MVEVEEIELDLELSIGGRGRGRGKGTSIQNQKPESRPGSGVVSDPDPCMAKRKRGTGMDRVGESEMLFKREKKDFVETTPFQQYGAVQFVPLNNGGLALPCWFQNVGGIDGVNNGDGKVRSNGSSRCSSSAVSDYQCEDVGSADSHSHSGNSSANLSHLTSSKEINNIRIQPEETSASSNPIRPKHANNLQDNRNHHNNVINESASASAPVAAAAATNNKSLPLPILKETNIGKSSTKPLTQSTPSKSLLQMPYVSTKGNGPNGKTVNGFLYRYSKSEVSIICVCHGSTFSPAEFVQHAGGTDISQPLRHITVIPSAFG